MLYIVVYNNLIFKFCDLMYNLRDRNNSDNINNNNNNFLKFNNNNNLIIIQQ